MDLACRMRSRQDGSMTSIGSMFLSTRLGRKLKAFKGSKVINQRLTSNVAYVQVAPSGYATGSSSLVIKGSLALLMCCLYTCITSKLLLIIDIIHIRKRTTEILS